MIDLNTLISIFVFIIGACIGSFSNVVALRGLSGESIVFPPSKCPKCGNKLNWYTNIPVISYCFLRGKCEFCKSAISLQYPIVEALNAILYLMAFLTFGYTFKTLFLFPLITLFIIITVTDLKESVVLDAHTYIIMGLGLIYSLIPGAEINFLQSIIGIFAGFILFEALARLGFIFAETRAFGEGDTLIAMGIGAFFGWKPLFLIVFMSVLIQAFMTIPILLNKAVKNKNYKEASAYFMLILCVILVYLFKKFNLYDNFMLIIILLLMVCILLLWALKVILADIRNKKETNDFLYLPFGPALAVSAIIMIFYQTGITDFFHNFLSI